MLNLLAYLNANWKSKEPGHLFILNMEKITRKLKHNIILFPRAFQSPDFRQCKTGHQQAGSNSYRNGSDHNIFSPIRSRIFPYKKKDVKSSAKHMGPNSQLL